MKAKNQKERKRLMILCKKKFVILFLFMVVVGI